MIEIGSFNLLAKLDKIAALFSSLILFHPCIKRQANYKSGYKIFEMKWNAMQGDDNALNEYEVSIAFDWERDER